MLDVNFIRENPEKVKEGIIKKGYNPELVERVLELDKRRRELLQKAEELRAERNRISKQQTTRLPPACRHGRDGQANNKQRGREIKEELRQLEPDLDKTTVQYEDALQEIPNLPLDDVPEGKDESGNKVVRNWGKPPKFNFKTRDHLELGELLGIIDVEKAVKVSGARFAYLKGNGVLLEFALVKYALDVLTGEGFVPIIPPVLIKEESMSGMGYLEHGGKEDMYVLDKDGLVLVGTSEQAIGPMHKNEILENLPLRYAGFSPCFRREAGSYGKDTKGILRVHQFDKVEMFSFTMPDDGDKEHEYFVSLEEKLFQALKIPYQVVKMCTGDLGHPAARKYDIEAWMPSQAKYREVTSASTITDYQARRLNIKYREGGKTGYVHMLNGTAFAIGRTIIAILENYQQEDGSVIVPEVLRPYLGKDKITSK